MEASDFRLFDNVVHQPARLLILAHLASGSEVDFKFLKSTLKLTDGNLGRHLTTLHDAGMIRYQSGYNGKSTRTWISITNRGQTAFKHEAQLLKMIIAAAENGN
ncbi:transcriptional regulator [Rhodococcus sp. 14-2470-1a]|uniref:transcriptional regulator n=1 Tax=Rhodococcus sp. 14-2470-1a TaxID=2023150 RepID=UPI000B9BDA44|nr:transcriptional regulator [Rhodococcus sp. 14-2470-1a]OZF42627.1 MarR family transcriptional regulator [Rhodococcus sp. 14-2470-1a]